MKAQLAIASLIVAALAASTVVNAQDRDSTRDTNRDQPKTFVKDSVITTKIKAKLASERLSSLAKIHVDTEANGKVWLTGSANSQDQIDKAVAIARATENVTAVENRLTVKKDD
jgi:hyperosmotically inducible periplasmic protein